MCHVSHVTCAFVRCGLCGLLVFSFQSERNRAAGCNKGGLTVANIECYSNLLFL